MLGLFVAAVVHVGGVAVDVAPRPFAFASCRAAAQYADETGHADVNVRYVWDQPRFDGREYVGLLRALIRSAQIETAAFRWNAMTDGERAAAERSQTALLTHELGHVATIEAALRGQELPVTLRAPTPAAYAALARRTGDRFFAELQAANEAYDTLTAHGIAQWNAPLAPYRAESTRLVCPPPAATAAR